jgi:hypothetical protein
MLKQGDLFGVSNIRACLNMGYKRGQDYKHRQAVLERDKSICVICGLDCSRLKLVALRRWANGRNRKRLLRRWPWIAASRFSNEPSPGPYWQMDHILPVSEGGGERGIDNLRTLCIGCHSKETGKLAGRNAKVKRVRTKHEAWKISVDQGPVETTFGVVGKRKYSSFSRSR